MFSSNLHEVRLEVPVLEFIIRDYANFCVTDGYSRVFNQQLFVKNEKNLYYILLIGNKSSVILY